jgi:hypothetical protein
VVPAVNAFLRPTRKLRKVPRLLISGFSAIGLASAERGYLFAFDGGGRDLIHNSSTGTWV